VFVTACVAGGALGLHGAIDAGEIPLAAVPSLVELASIHRSAGLRVAAVSEAPEQSWQRPIVGLMWWPIRSARHLPLRQ